MVYRNGGALSRQPSVGSSVPTIVPERAIERRPRAHESVSGRDMDWPSAVRTEGHTCLELEAELDGSR